MSSWTACSANTIISCDDAPVSIKNSPGKATVFPPPINTAFPYTGTFLCPLSEPWKDENHVGKTLWVRNESNMAYAVGCRIYHGPSKVYDCQMEGPPGPQDQYDITEVAANFVGTSEHLGWTIAIDVKFLNSLSNFTVESAALEFVAQ